MRTGQAVTQFAPALVLHWAYPSTAAPQAHERFELSYYDETAQQWVRLPERLLRAQRRLKVDLPHLTLLAVTAESSFVPEVMPSIRGVQSDLFTGSASLTYPIALPPGRGGLTPELALQFNSQSRHNDPGNSSVLATGWKMSADSFIGELWEYGLLQTYIWRIAGVAYTEAGNGSTGWYFKETPQWRIVKSGDTRDAYAPDGTRYHFEPALYAWNDDGRGLRTNKWVLQYVRNPQGNQIDYVYDSGLPVIQGDVASNWGSYTDAQSPAGGCTTRRTGTDTTCRRST